MPAMANASVTPRMVAHVSYSGIPPRSVSHDGRCVGRVSAPCVEKDGRHVAATRRIRVQEGRSGCAERHQIVGNLRMCHTQIIIPTW